MRRRALLAALGLLLAAPAVLGADYLATEGRTTPGLVGFLVLLAAPGLAVVAWALGGRSGLRWTLPLVAVSFALLGLDVTDSSVSNVVWAGWALAGASAAVAAGTAFFLLRAAPWWPHPDGRRPVPGRASAHVDPLLAAVVICLPLVFIAVLVGADALR